MDVNPISHGINFKGTRYDPLIGGIVPECSGRKKGIMHDCRTGAGGMTWSYDDCVGSALLCYVIIMHNSLQTNKPSALYVN